MGSPLAERKKDDAEAQGDGDSQPGPVKLGLTFKQNKGRLAPPKVAPSKIPDDAKKDFVLAVGEKGLETSGGRNRSEVKVIPKLENKWRPESKMRSMQETMRDHAIVQKTEERFEVQETVSAGKVEGVQYGLQIRVKKEEIVAQTEQMDPVPESTGYRSSGYKNAQELETQQFKKDLLELPDEADVDAYDSMPIEDFGKAMLRGMGWIEGKAVGRNSKGKVVEPVVNVPRPDRLGLGAAPKPPEVKEKKYIKPGETRGPKPDLVAAPGADGRARNSRTVKEQLVERVKTGVHVGKVMEIVGGRHSGLKGEVLSIKKAEPGSGRSDRAAVRLRGSEETVEVRVQELADIESANGHGANKVHRVPVLYVSDRGAGTNGAAEDRTRRPEGDSSSQKEERNGRERDSSREGGRRDDEPRLKRKVDDSRRLSEGREEDGRGGNEAPWLVPHIRVRIVSKSLQSGRLYLKKATVVDVVTPTTADLLVDESGQSLQGVHQSSLETALPKRGGNVAVVSGEQRGRRGRLLERDSDRGVGVVQFSDHQVEGVEIVRLELDSVAEFVGHDEDLD
jgi:G patch domain/KOW motif-containing protein